MIITIINNIDPDLWTVFGGLKAEDSFHGHHFLKPCGLERLERFKLTFFNSNIDNLLINRVWNTHL